MSFLDGFQKALSGITPLRQNCHKCQKEELGGEKGISGIIGNSVSIHSTGEKGKADNWLTAPTAAELTHARRMMLKCPVRDMMLHCWHCSRCEEISSCTAWRTRNQDVEFFKKHGEPYSLFLTDSLITEGIGPDIQF